MITINSQEEKQRALIFLERKDIVHISRLNNSFHNGIIIEVSDDFFVLKDRKNGQEVLVLFSELKHPLQLYREEGENDLPNM